MTLRYTGALAVAITVSDQGGIIYAGALITPGSEFSFIGSNPLDKFLGPTITVTVNALPNAIIGTNCASGVAIGNTYGSFTVVALSSLTGGTICCPAPLIETTPPVISGCPANISQPAGSSCNAVVTWTVPTATDNCTLASLTSTHSPGATFPTGNTNVTYTATDVYGNTSTCSFVVTVTDNTPPVIASCPANINLFAAANCKTIATWTAPTVSDNCSVSSFTSTHTSGSEFNLGSTTVTYTATDAAGNTSTCSFTVTVTDNTPPVIAGCPANINLFAAANCKAVATWTAPTVSDNCSVSSFISTHASGSEFNLGSTTVTYTATDAAGNSSTCSFTVTVTDNTPPVIASCPANINLFAAANCKAVATWTAPTASDNCSVSSFTSTHTSGSEFNLGSTTVTYTATDAAGNTSTCSFTVTVTDNTPPVIANCPANINLFSAANCKAIATWTAPTASDNCSVSSFTSTHTSGSEFNLGSTTVTYTATDAAGNTSTCSFVVTVTDNAPPVIASCPANINLFAAANCKAVATWTAPTASDNCSVSSFTSTYTSGSEFNLGSTTVTYTATDAAGNTSTCSFVVTVTDNAPPVIASCPANINLFAAANCKAVATWTVPTVSDNCSVSSFISTHASGTEFNLGSTTVTYTATDAAGNTSTCSFVVTVTDNAPPVIASCPANITVPAGANCKAIVTWTPPTSSDNCGIAAFTSSHPSGFEFDIGTTIVTYTAQDNAGNISRCTFDVTVSNNQTITVSGCPEPIEIFADETGTAEVQWIEPIFTAPCGNLNIQRSFNPGSRFSPGTNTVRYLATDPLGNTSECNFSITVVLRDLEIKLSQLVTPDGDGFNDTWQIYNINQFPNNEVIVYDRWGGQVFKTVGYNNDTNSWDGTRSGNDLPTGTYFYFIRVKYGDRTAKKEGFIELVR